MRDSSENFLEKALERLGYAEEGSLYDLRQNQLDNRVPIEQVHWIEAANALGARASYFSKNYPLFFFFEFDSLDEEKVFYLQRKMWNLSKVPFFFIALPGELRLYSAYEAPVRDFGQWVQKPTWLERIQELTLIVDVLADFQKRVEGEELSLYSQIDRNQRADACLLRNLRLVQSQLESAGLSSKVCHALIGRSIFIRYLEDRKVLVPQYFTSVSPSSKKRDYFDILGSKEDTYRLFEKLSQDFNGDAFPVDPEERKLVSDVHLQLLRDFLQGKRMDEQQELFFWAYQFDMIPVELLSNIYEEFYHTGVVDDKGTHYTPVTLVDFVLSTSLTRELMLKRELRVMDPACGSGIFLVETFRRIVRQRLLDYGELPSYEDMIEILTKTIVGIDVNEEALRVAAFSLYLALLDFMDPSDIRQHKLPKLIYNVQSPAEGGDTLYCINAFSLSQLFGAERRDQKENQCRANNKEKFFGEFDLIVGNPPWGQAPNDVQGNCAVKWCDDRRLPVGDKELSQCFIWLASALVRPQGTVALIVSSGMFFKHNMKSVSFRKMWLTRASIKDVYNFAHVRHSFFQGPSRAGAVSPFAVIVFSNTQVGEALHNKVYYASVRQRLLTDKLQAIVVDKAGAHFIEQSQFLVDDLLWKILLWGSTADRALLDEVRIYQSLGEFIRERQWECGQGFTPGTKYESRDELASLPLIDNRAFNSNYRSVPLRPIPETPTRVHRRGNSNLFYGKRILMKQGVNESNGAMGQIIARVEDSPMCFTNSVLAIRLNEGSPDWEAKCILAILWSSFARYFQFMTCSAWGFWHHQIHKEEYLRLPIRLAEGELRTKIVDLVDELLTLENKIFSPDTTDIVRKLDDCIYELFELSLDQRELIEDFCQYTLDYFYNGTASEAMSAPREQMLFDYVQAFMEIWNDRLGTRDLQLVPQIYASSELGLVGVVFSLAPRHQHFELTIRSTESEWRRLSMKLESVLPRHLGGDVYNDRVFKMIFDTEFLLVKRAQKMKWTRSRARSDAAEFLTELYKQDWNRGTES